MIKKNALKIEIKKIKGSKTSECLSRFMLLLTETNACYLDPFWFRVLQDLKINMEKSNLILLEETYLIMRIRSLCQILLLESFRILVPSFQLLYYWQYQVTHGKRVGLSKGLLSQTIAFDQRRQNNTLEDCSI